MPPNSEVIRLRVKIIETIENSAPERTNDLRLTKFRCSVNDDQFQEIVRYIDIIYHIEKEDTEIEDWKFKGIIGHQDPLSRGDEGYMG